MKKSDWYYPVSFIHSARFHSMGGVYTFQQKGKETIKHSQLWTLQALVMTDLPRCASWCNNDNNISGITNHILIWSVQLCKIKLKLGTFGGEKHINVHVPRPQRRTFFDYSTKWSCWLFIIVPTDKFILQPSSKKLLLAVDCGEHRDPQLFTIAQEILAKAIRQSKEIQNP